mmetsp:Transcript_14140/g.37454  ORF Transcript_14140/g.37454 Transcript_14140/m.37454 type:complete len:304 (-) Transcript_14140:1937-2848(-)
MSGGSLPSSSCWPRQQLICEWFTEEPFAPVWTMAAKQFFGKGIFWPIGMHWLIMSDQFFFMLPIIMPSSSCSASSFSSRSCAASESMSTSYDPSLNSGRCCFSSHASAAALARERPALTRALRLISVSSVRSRSLKAQVKPRVWRSSVMRRATEASSTLTMWPPISSKRTCVIPIMDAPNWLLSRTPCSSSESMKRTIISSLSPSIRPFQISPGVLLLDSRNSPSLEKSTPDFPWSQSIKMFFSSMENTCFPVQTSLGFRMDGGSRWSRLRCGKVRTSAGSAPGLAPLSRGRSMASSAARRPP